MPFDLCRAGLCVLSAGVMGVWLYKGCWGRGGRGAGDVGSCEPPG